MAAELHRGAKDMVGEAKGRAENLTPDQVERELDDVRHAFLKTAQAQ